MRPFDPNDYRKRVLAAVERRGGVEHSDPFELYDVPLELAETLTDAEVAARVTEVWGFWQRQRDHPKYRVLVGVLVANHERLSYLLLDGSARRAEALRIRREREERDAERLVARVGTPQHRHASEVGLAEAGEALHCRTIADRRESSARHARVRSVVPPDMIVRSTGQGSRAWRVASRTCARTRAREHRRRVPQRFRHVRAGGPTPAFHLPHPLLPGTGRSPDALAPRRSRGSALRA